MSIDIPTLIESLSGNNEDQRNLYYAFYSQLQLLNKATGNSQVNPVNSKQAPSTPPPAVGTISVSGANGTYQVSLTNAAQGGVNATLYNQISYSPIKSFGENVTTTEPSSATTATFPNPGQTLFFRARWSFDRVTWSSWVLAATTAVSSNLQSSAASENNTVLNQSNYAYIDSIDPSGGATVRIYGAAGPYNGWTGVKGGEETPLPSASIINVEYGSDQIAAYDGEQYQVGTTLPQVFSDKWTPVGQVSVVGTGTPTLPILTPVLSSSGGHVISATFTSGAGLTEPPVLTVTDPGGPGTGAVLQAIIAGGAMTGVQVLNPGADYDTNTAITATGGVFGGATGGGTASGGNGGRLTKI